MSIEALPQNVVRNLGSSQALASPITAVKELIDNAFDARASSIAIEISRNTLDIIQVRDNGCGIPPQDRKLIAVPHCTSKITNESDLRLLGGSSLGFRGEALSSAAQLSKTLTMTTRIEGEQIASALTFSRDGQVVGERNVSSPVGTLARISDFFHYNPVRKQMAIKNAEGNLKHVKKMLQAYALARPQVRLSLKVLKSQNAHSDWLYAPQPHGTTIAIDVVAKVVGAACASQCKEYRIESDGFVLSSVLPRPYADATKVGGFGSFLSIDNRPVAPNRGTLRKIIEHFHDSLKNVKCATLHTVKSPFLQLDISCPPGVYDINVEPSKDDVLFADPQDILTLTANFFASVYPVGNAGSEVVERRDVCLANDASPERRVGVAEDDPFAAPEVHRDRAFIASTPSQSAQVRSVAHDVDAFQEDQVHLNPCTIMRSNARQHRPAAVPDLRSGGALSAQDAQGTGLLTPQNSSPLRLARHSDHDDTMIHSRIEEGRPILGSRQPPSLDRMPLTALIRHQDSSVRQMQMPPYIDNLGTPRSARSTPSPSQFLQLTHSTPSAARSRASTRGRGTRAPNHRGNRSQQHAVTDAKFDNESIGGAAHDRRQTRLPYGRSAPEGRIHTNVSSRGRRQGIDRPASSLDAFHHPGGPRTHATPPPTEQPMHASRVLLGPPPISTMYLPLDHDLFMMPDTAPVAATATQVVPRAFSQDHPMHGIADNQGSHLRRVTGRIPRTRTANLPLESISPEAMVCHLVLRLNMASLGAFHIGEKTFDKDATLLLLGRSSYDHDFDALEYTPAMVSEIQRVVESVASGPGANKPAKMIKGIQQALKVQ